MELKHTIGKMCSPDHKERLKATFMAYFYAGSSEYFSFHYFDSNIGVCISGIFYVGVLLDNSYYSIFCTLFS